MITSRSHILSISFAIILFSILTDCKSKNTYRVPWEDKTNPDFITAHFEVFAEPSLQFNQYNQQVEEAERIWMSFQKDFFPQAQNKQKIKLIIYGNQKSYSRYRRVPVDSLADFERKEKRINISVDASVSVWKHELSHAMLESVRPKTPFWLHEGLALFLQAQQFQYPLSCGRPQKAAMPYSLSFYIEQVRQNAGPLQRREFGSKSSRPTPEAQSSMAGYFIFFLWDKKMLHKLLHSYQNSNRGAEELLAGNRQKDREKLLEEFEIWLRSPRPLMEIEGC